MNILLVVHPPPKSQKERKREKEDPGVERGSTFWDGGRTEILRREDLSRKKARSKE